MQRILRSPVNLKKKVPQSKVFGLPLAHQMRNLNGDVCIPFIVKKIVEFIVKHGIGHEGIFRMSGSSRVVDKLRSAFDKYGDADLEEAEDVMAVASLLKLYLRELPEPIVPAEIHRRFLAIYEGNDGSNLVNQLDNMKEILDDLPKENYVLLKYLNKFLVQVSQHESTNKMTPFALAIVFGPNFFRCDVGFQSFKEQGMINNIVKSFIQDYSQLFEGVQDTLASPTYSSTIIQVQENQSLSPPQIKPRKKKKKTQTKPVVELKDLNSNSIIECDLEANYMDKNDVNGSSALLSPHDIAFDRAHSPFHLDSDTGTSNTATPVTNVSCSELVEKAIGDSISYHLFGENEERDSSTESPPQRPQRRKDFNRKQLEIDTTKRITDESRTDSESSSSKDKSLLDSPAFKQFEKAGIIIQPRTSSSVMPSLLVPEDLLSAELSPRSKRRQKNVLAMSSNTPVKTSQNTRKPLPTGAEDEELENISRKTDVLSSLTAKRVTPPKNRRKPTRKQRFDTDIKVPEDMKHEIMDSEPLRSKDQESVLSPYQADMTQESKETHHRISPHRMLREKENHNGVSISQMLGGQENRSGVSVSQMLKIDIPPLNLDSLHEHVDGNEPIQAWKSKVTLKTDGEALLSPRSSKLQRTSSVPEDTDVPPSPPNSQPYLKGSSRTDDGENVKVKQLSRKIRSLKKKIRRFEERFYEENGFKPSHSDKASNADIKKIMTELKQANKDLKKIKANVRSEDYTEQPDRPSSEPRSLFSAEKEDTSGKVEALRKAQEMLEKKRQESNRTHDLQLMTYDEVQEEKVAVQKALLQLESDYGRPRNKADKELMRPLYDRYRSIKKMILRYDLRGRNLEEPRAASSDLQTIEEGEETKEFVAKASPTSHDEYLDKLFMVTQKIPEVDSPRDFDDPSPSPSGQATINMEHELTLHQASLEELLMKQHEAKQNKKQLRKKLKDFEDDFLKEKGRKLQKEDWVPLGEEYEQYKHVKKQLKLLDALISKHDDSPQL
ncbi:protein FAM13A-like [Anneissia japonica]|uniref:protein FAM13A-like n=1 Tax=Anneissia japonica TaxID=1529436 RepID=UPI0014256286|nr:protein FAM13A-like [Anneissia japonica]XP_033121330.1 protein FAM13A-like [Anneissia japonica]XP_033121331.1 protein FAM13A-like [Anneissia japonica]